MESSDKKEQENNKFKAVKAFPLAFALDKIEENLTISTQLPSKYSKEQIINQAFKFHSQGNILEALRYYQHFINEGFKDHRVFSNYGIILKNLGKLKEAELSIRTAIELKPDYAEAHSNLGNILKDLDNLEEAEVSTRTAIRLKPDYAEAHSNLGNILKDLGNLEEAEVSTRTAIGLKPDFAMAHSNLGSILKDLGNLQEAEVSTRTAIGLQPDYAEAHSNLGSIFSNLGNLQEAELSTRKAIRLKPDYAEAHSNLGSILSDLGNLEEAEVSTRKAIELKPDYAIAHSNLGSILSDLGNLQEAEVSTRKAIELELKPDHAQAHCNLGSILSDLGNLQEAEVSTRQTIEQNPNLAEAFFNLSLIQLLKGNYKDGLENYEFRLKKKRPALIHGKTKLKRIDNQLSNQESKILVVSEQGLGDTLQYMRYIPYLRKKGLDVSFSAQTKLHSLIQSSAIDQNPLTPEQVEKVSARQWIPLLSLARYLKISPKNPIISQPYIFSTDQFTQKWKNIFSKEKRPIIGINWQGNPEMEKRSYHGRSIPLETFSLLFKQNELSILSLQKGFGSEQLEQCSFKNKFVECQPQINSTWDFLENAAIIQNCDLIITCDTSIAHLAGGMGKKVWLLLRDIPFWTWGLKEETTFWYPSMRLFRQHERHNWQEVMERVSIALKKEICK
ncbi:tetratricopeptide repeat protein [Prochlorococcus marinus]|uniref:tetratricopeptide repeat protein n=1 Tax=Prochlorococcus marinus TaxID=1219 RepID=UPI0022B365B4|nr:tetratricopeptide repeat protein [Prochlorococcus marinus]